MKTELVRGLLGGLLAATFVLLLTGAAAAAGGDGVNPFVRGAWTSQFTGGYAQDLDGDENIAIASAGLGYYLYDNISVNAEFLGYCFDQEGDGAIAVGVNLLGRWQPVSTEDLSMFIEAGIGYLNADDPVPPGGTHNNFTPQAGLGLTYRLTGRAHLLGGVRYLHVSNANIDGTKFNSGIDSLYGYLGVMITF